MRKSNKPEQNRQVFFDEQDLHYLAVNFSLSELRYELRKAGIEAAVCRQFGDSAEYYWKGYARALQLAIKRRSSSRAKAGNTAMNCFSQARDVKAQNDIVEIIGQYVELRPCGKRWRGLCPFHDDTNPSFFIFPDTQRAHCFGCGWSGDVIQFIRDYHSLDFQQAMQHLGAALPPGKTAKKYTVFGDKC